MNQRVIRRKELRSITGLSDSTVWRLEQSGDFPPRRKLSTQAVGWVLSEVLHWLEERQATNSPPQG